MDPYEMTFIIRPDLDEEQTRGVAEQVANRIRSNGGEIIAMYPWSPARRRMAYPIRDFGDGFYVTVTFNYNPQSIRELENALKLNERILRFLVVQATEQMIRQSQQRVQQQAAAAAAPPPQPAPQPQPVGTAVPPVQTATQTVPAPRPAQPTQGEHISAVPVVTRESEE